ncbi:MAG: hypothetical protein ACRDSE_15180 [Pseudonocardiaceae bacterium]
MRQPDTATVASDAESRALSESETAGCPGSGADGKPGRLHRPWRAVVAAGELVLAVLAVWLAFVAWSHGITTITAELDDGTALTSTRYHGNWIAASIGLGTLASVLVLDAVREMLLAVRTRRVRRRNPDRAAWPQRDEDT